MIKNDGSLSHTWDKENMEEYLRYYLDDEDIVLTDKQWKSIAINVNREIEKYYQELMDDIVEAFDIDPTLSADDPNVQRVLGL